MINGVVNLYKAPGPTSFAAVQAVRKVLGVKKAGHAGTLDPLAEGVLPICLNESTKIVQFLSGLSKKYAATLELGTATDSQDATGKKIFESDPSGISAETVETRLKSFIGEQLQVPPMFSAKKKNGIPLYKLARNGITVPREPVPICIYNLEMEKKEGNLVSFTVECSAGTYIRTLCHDLGTQLGCGAFMVHLKRTAVGGFDEGRSLSLEELALARENNTFREKIYPIEEALSFIPEIAVKEDRIRAVSNGAALTKSFLKSFPENFKSGMNFCVKDSDRRLVAVVESVTDQNVFNQMVSGDVVFKPKRVFV